MIGMRSMPGNPYDGHTLAETLEQVSILPERKPTTAIVDKGYRGMEIEDVRILRSDQKRGIASTQGDDPSTQCDRAGPIGHMKMDGRLARNPLKGAFGRRAACGDVRGWAQPEVNPGEAAASFHANLDRTIRVAGHVDRATQLQRSHQRLKTGLFRADSDSDSINSCAS